MLVAAVLRRLRPSSRIVGRFVPSSSMVRSFSHSFSFSPSSILLAPRRKKGSQDDSFPTTESADSAEHDALRNNLMKDASSSSPASSSSAVAPQRRKYRKKSASEVESVKAPAKRGRPSKKNVDASSTSASRAGILPSATVSADPDAEALLDDLVETEHDQEESLLKTEEEDEHAQFGKMDEMMEDEEMYELDDDINTHSAELRMRRGRMAPLDFDALQAGEGVDVLHELPEGMSTLTEDEFREEAAADGKDLSPEQELAETARLLRAQSSTKAKPKRVAEEEAKAMAISYDVFSADGVFSPDEIQHILEDDDSLPDDVVDAILAIETERAQNEGRLFPRPVPPPEDEALDPYALQADLRAAEDKLQEAVDTVRGAQRDAGDRVEAVYGRFWRVYFTEECEKYIARRLTPPSTEVGLDVAKLYDRLHVVRRCTEKARKYCENLRTAASELNMKDHNPYFYGFLEMKYNDP